MKFTIPIMLFYRLLIIFDKSDGTHAINKIFINE